MVMELPASVQGYVILHELCHTVETNHMKAFWALLARHMPDWQRQHEVMERRCLEMLSSHRLTDTER